MSVYAGSTDTPHFVYRCYSAAGDLLYVGCSVNVGRRMREHMPSPWAAAVARVDTEGPYPYALARRIEADAIHDEDPAHNANAPTSLSNHRRRTWLMNEVFHTALKHGESTAEAGRLAQIAVSSETPALAASP